MPYIFSKNEINRLGGRLISFFEKIKETVAIFYKVDGSALKAGVHAEKNYEIWSRIKKVTTHFLSEARGFPF